MPEPSGSAADRPLGAAAAAALGRKIAAYRTGLMLPADPLTATLRDDAGAASERGYDETPIGRYDGLAAIRLRWVAPDWFAFLPAAVGPFRFVRASGEAIAPGAMFTDGGSVPRMLWIAEALSPWGYAPAFLVHDWEFARHHDGLGDKSFEAVRDTMMEGVKTLMESGLCPKSRLIFRALQAGIDSPIARQIWDRQPDGPVLPPAGSI